VRRGGCTQGCGLGAPARGAGAARGWRCGGHSQTKGSAPSCPASASAALRGRSRWNTALFSFRLSPFRPRFSAAAFWPPFSGQVVLLCPTMPHSEHFPLDPFLRPRAPPRAAGAAPAPSSPSAIAAAGGSCGSGERRCSCTTNQCRPHATHAAEFERVSRDRAPKVAAPRPRAPWQPTQLQPRAAPRELAVIKRAVARWRAAPPAFESPRGKTLLGVCPRGTYTHPGPPPRPPLRTSPGPPACGAGPGVSGTPPKCNVALSAANTGDMGPGAGGGGVATTNSEHMCSLF